MKRFVPAILVLPLLLSGCASGPASGKLLSSAAVSSAPQSIAPQSSSTSSEETDHNYATYGKVTLGGKTYSVEVVQTKAIPPDVEKYPLSAAVGKFDLVVRDAGGKELNRQNLNALYGNKMIGCWGTGEKSDDTLMFSTDPEKKRCLFGIPVGHGDKENVTDEGAATLIFSLDETGSVKIMPVEGGYAFGEAQHNHTVFYRMNSTLDSFQVNPGRGVQYVWDGKRYARRPTG